METQRGLISPTFVTLTLSALAYFFALGVVQPVLPRFVEDELGGGGLAIGVAVGAFAVTAALGRPVAGRIGDLWGRRVLVMGGASVMGVSLLLYGQSRNLATLVVLRLVSGLGEAATFVGAATAVQDLAPDERRGEAASYFSIAVFGGLGVGAPVGEAVLHHSGSGTVWTVAAGACAVACVLGLSVPTHPADRVHPGSGPPPRPRGILQRDAIRPGIVLALAMTGYAAFSTFVPVYVRDIGLDDAGFVFALYAVIVLFMRIVAARVPDRLGAVPTATGGLTVLAAGLALMAALAFPVGLYIATAVFSLGQSLLYPSLLPLAIGRAPAAERSHAMATFTLFFDVSQGLGAVALGGVVAVFNERAAFLAGALVCLSAVAVLRRGPLGRAA